MVCMAVIVAHGVGERRGSFGARRDWREAGLSRGEWVAVVAKVVKEKVLVYVVRDERLLVFRHVDVSFEEVGIQVPAGSVRAGEPPEDAALREAREETGLEGFRIVRKLGVAEYDVSPYRFEVQRRHVFHVEVGGDVPERWGSCEEHDGEGAPTRFECFWIPLAAAHVLQSGQGALIGCLFEG